MIEEDKSSVGIEGHDLMISRGRSTEVVLQHISGQLHVAYKCCARLCVRYISMMSVRSRNGDFSLPAKYATAHKTYQACGQRKGHS